MPLTPEAKQRLMDKLKGGAAPKKEPPRGEDEPMDPEERMVESDDLLMDEEDSEMGEGPMDPNAPMDDEEMLEEPEPPMEPEDRGAVSPSTYDKRREEERRIGGPSGPIDPQGMRRAAQEAIANASQGRR